MLKPAKSAEQPKHAKRCDHRCRYLARDRFVDDTKTTQSEGREQVQIVSDRNKIGEDQRQIGQSLHHYQMARWIVLHQRFDAHDIVADRLAENIGYGAQRRHAGKRPMPCSMT